MFLHNIYLALKQHLSAPANLTLAGIPIFLYIGQYRPGKDNTSYSIPAIYIELPKDSKIKSYPKKVMSIKDVSFKIHYISYAPFKNADNAMQETAIAQHETILRAIDQALSEKVFKDVSGNNLTEQFLTQNVNLLNFLDKAVFSILDYKTEVYSQHLTV
jgi:hypothetical protein